MTETYTIKDHNLYCGDIIVSSEINVLGQGRDTEQGNWSKLISLRDPDGNLKEFVIPYSALIPGQTEWLKELTDAGLICKNPKRLQEYIAHQNSDIRYRLANRTGWFKNVFVFPGYTIGDSEEPIRFFNNKVKDDYKTSGTLENWTREIGSYCQGNDRLILGISLSLAGPLLDKLKIENGGIHLIGKSSTGKSTIARVASSVWGDSSFLKSWRTTTNGLEALASSRNDTHLTMDELNQAEPKQVGQMSYLLGNGEGKTRGTITGAYKEPAHWRLLVLSTGEKGFSDCAKENKTKYMAGEGVRMVELPAVGIDYQYGCFQNDHGLTGKGLSDKLNTAVTKYYGTPSRTFIEKLIKVPKETLQDLFDTNYRFISQELDKDTDGQVFRVAKRFALICTAGQLAVRFGILPLSETEVQEAVNRCFEEWLLYRGGHTAQEEKAILDQFKIFMELNSETRFTKLTRHSEDTFWDGCTNPDDYSEEKSRGPMAGYVRTLDGKTQYLIFPGVFKEEICSGYPVNYAKEILCKNGWLLDKDSMSIRVGQGNSGMKRLYIFTDKFWDYSPDSVSSVSSVSE